MQHNEQELVAVAGQSSRPKHHPANVAKAINEVVLVPLNDVCNTVATGYGYGSFYALLVKGKERQLFNIMYFTPTIIPLGIHLLPFKPENKKHYRKQLHKILHVALNSAFLSAAAEQIFIATAGDIDQFNRIFGIAGIQIATTVIAIPCTYYDLKMHAGEHLPKLAELFIKFGLRPLQSAATLGFFLDIFDGHLHMLPSWGALAVGGGLGVTRLGYEIYAHIKGDAAERVQRFVEMVVQAILEHISTDSIIFSIVLSLYAANHADTIPDNLLIIMSVLTPVLFVISSISSVLSYAYDEPEVKPQGEDVKYELLEDDDEEEDDEEEEVVEENQSPPTSKLGLFADSASNIDTEVVAKPKLD